MHHSNKYGWIQWFDGKVFSEKINGLYLPVPAKVRALTQIMASDTQPIQNLSVLMHVQSLSVSESVSMYSYIFTCIFFA